MERILWTKMIFFSICLLFASFVRIERHIGDTVTITLVQQHRPQLGFVRRLTEADTHVFILYAAKEMPS